MPLFITQHETTPAARANLCFNASRKQTRIRQERSGNAGFRIADTYRKALSFPFLPTVAVADQQDIG